MTTVINKSTRLSDAKRVVVKIGSALLVDPETGRVHRDWLDSLSEDIAGLMAAGMQVVLVSSGAIAVGRRHLGLDAGTLRLEEKQAAAATGMVHLAHAYQDVLAKHDITVAQVLLTLDDSENRRRYINARNTLETLLSRGAVPLINENDTVATDEIRMGDNDRLAARVAAMVSADTLVLLSDIDGMYTADPRSNAEAEFVAVVEGVTAEVETMAGTAGSSDGTGGMVTKLAAAKIALSAGCRMAIASGHGRNALGALLGGGRATWFLSDVEPKTQRKRWIAGSLKPQGIITVDDGAEKALKSGRSLLPIGVVSVDGEFSRGEAVLVRSKSGADLARGLMAYPAVDAKKLIGHKSDEIESLIGYRGRDALIHRDDLVLL